MAKITEVSVGVRRLIALAKYENVTYECNVTATVSDEENPQEVYQELLSFCKDKIGSEVDRLQARN